MDTILNDVNGLIDGSNPAVVDLLGNESAFSGYLNIVSHARMDWVRRFFMLSSSTLFMFATSAPSETAVDRFPIHGGVRVFANSTLIDNAFVFEITDGSKLWILGAASPTGKDTWMTMVQLTASRAPLPPATLLMRTPSKSRSTHSQLSPTSAGTDDGLLSVYPPRGQYEFFYHPLPPRHASVYSHSLSGSGSDDSLLAANYHYATLQASQPAIFSPGISETLGVQGGGVFRGLDDKKKPERKKDLSSWLKELY
ncbi:hypothetical protein HK100_004866 [Physocladia obscura]|uniref:PH domain-containing protein n=1 Tax=Physocladia obscura TaxID=109957 RepID=A0AAD5T613_9FUNG|nr:hypothetical protein HK100_004866 [Physocladia obscura]